MRQPAFLLERCKPVVLAPVLQVPGFVFVITCCKNEEQKRGKDQPYDKRTHVGLLLS